MRKTIFIFILFILNIISFYYLEGILSSRKAYPLRFTDNILIYQTKPIELYEISEFSFEDYFRILSFFDVSYLYEIQDQAVIVNINDDHYEFPYMIKEKEKEVVEKVVYKEVYVNNKTEDNKTSESKKEETEYEDYDYEEDYFHLLETYCSFEKGTDLSTIINQIQSYIDTNQRVSVDYSSLNPNSEGLYTVFFVTESQKYELFVQIV